MPFCNLMNGRFIQDAAKSQQSQWLIDWHLGTIRNLDNEQRFETGSPTRLPYADDAELDEVSGR